MPWDFSAGLKVLYPINRHWIALEVRHGAMLCGICVATDSRPIIGLAEKPKH
jgi:hypothetical protein